MNGYDRWKLAYPPEWDQEPDEDPGEEADLRYEQDRDDHEP